MRLMIRDVRLAFPNLWKATAPSSGGEPAFSASFIMPPNHPQMKEVNAALNAVAKEKWGAKAPAIYKALESSDKLCLHDGDTKAEYDGYEGNKFISTRSKVRPTVIDQQRQELTEADGKPYSGCYVNASIELWAQDNNYGKRVNAQLRGVQFLRDGDAFAGGSRPADADEFDEIGVADGDDPLAA
jgi:Enterobacter phage Enc34, ssDNA-binding protein